MLLIYSPFQTNRLKYIFKLIFKCIYTINYNLTSNIEEYKAYQGPSLNYSNNPNIKENEILILSTSFLNETGIKEKTLSFFNWNNIPVFFLTSKKSDIPFDIFAYIFFLVSRYEEYLPHIKDEHGRYKPKESIAFKNNFLEKPTVNIASKYLIEIIQNKFHELKIIQPYFKFTPTFDVDTAFAFLERDLFRNIGGYLLSLKNLDWIGLKQRTKVLLGIEKDPYDTYDYHISICQKYGTKPIYFILYADYNHFDKNISVYNLKFQRLIKSLTDNAEIGIHPSYASFNNFSKKKEELIRLQRVVNFDINKSRQHFLRIDLPRSYRDLIALDITDDYSMGYASLPGFRASICTPFYFYDLDLEYESTLKIHPFAFMEGTYKDYMLFDKSEAKNSIQNLINEVKNVNGHLYTLWHNDSLSETGRWIGWREIFEYIFKEVNK